MDHLENLLRIKIIHIYFTICTRTQNRILYSETKKNLNTEYSGFNKKIQEFLFLLVSHDSGSIDPQKRVRIAFDILVRTYRKICIPSSAFPLPTISASTEAGKNRYANQRNNLRSIHIVTNISPMKYILEPIRQFIVVENKKREGGTTPEKWIFFGGGRQLPLLPK